MGVCGLSERNNRHTFLRILTWTALVLLLALIVHFDKISIQILFLLLAAGTLAALCFSRVLNGKAVRTVLIFASALLVFVVLLLGVGWPIAAKSAAYAVPEVDRDNLFAGRRVMLIVPHEDDEINLLSGVMEQYTTAGSELVVVFVTNGDSETNGETRITEALRATALYGIPEQNVLFLGYGDTGKEQKTHLYNETQNKLYRSSAGRTHTYGSKAHPAFRSLDYTRENLISDLQSALETWLPDTIYCVDYDAHPDHRATSLAFEKAMGRMLRQHADYAPLVYKGFAYSTAWQAANDFYTDNLLSSVDASQTSYMSENYVYKWDERLRLPVSADTLSRLAYQTLTQRALFAHDSQNAVWQTGRVLNSDKVFWPRYTTSLLYRAKVQASSGDVSALNDFQWVDSSNVISGELPIDNVWSPDPETAIPEITITLEQPTVLKELCLYDQPSLTDNVLGATILLDGTSAAEVGALVKNGSATVIPLQDTTPVSQIKIRITGTEGKHWGLTEVEAYTETPKTGVAFAKLTDEAGNFLYDAWTNPDGTLRLKVYRTPSADADWLGRCTVTSSNPACNVSRAGDSFAVSCPAGESSIVRLSDALDEVYSDTIRVSNPLPGERTWMHALQWFERHHFDPIGQRAYYRAIFNALASRLSKSF